MGNNTVLQFSLLPSRHEGRQTATIGPCLPISTSSGAKALADVQHPFLQYPWKRSPLPADSDNARIQLTIHNCRGRKQVGGYDGMWHFLRVIAYCSAYMPSPKALSTMSRGTPQWHQSATTARQFCTWYPGTAVYEIAEGWIC